MAVQGTDKLAASRMGIVGSVTLQEIAEIPTPINTHTDVNVSSSSNPKEVLKNNGSGIYENSTLSLDDLDDVDALTILPKIGWILKYNGIEFVPCMKEIYTKKDIITNTQTDFNLGVVIQQTLNFQRIGTYSFTFNCNFSHDSTGNDILMEALLNNSALSLINEGHILRLEQKDSGGNDLDGRGTNQKNFFSQKFYAEVISPGNIELIWRIRPESGGVESSVWESSVTIEEEFGITNL